MQVRPIKPLQKKLNSLTELPDGFSFDPARSWNQLEETITRKSSQKKKLFWFIAAASVMLVFSLVYFFRADEPKVAAIKSPSKGLMDSVGPEAKNNGQGPSISTAKQSIVVVMPSAGIRNNWKKKAAPEPDIVQQQVAVQIPVGDTIQIGTVSFETPSIAVGPAVPVKRKIIHINELGKEKFLKEQQLLSVKEENTVTEVLSEEAQSSVKPWYKKIKLSHRNN